MDSRLNFSLNLSSGDEFQLHIKKAGDRDDINISRIVKADDAEEERMNYKERNKKRFASYDGGEDSQRNKIFQQATPDGSNIPAANTWKDLIGNQQNDGWFYNMNYQKRGLFVIFNHENFDAHLNLDKREGTVIDKTSLEGVAKHLGFDVRTFNDLKKVDIMKNIAEISRNKGVDHGICDCFVCVILTHGASNDRLYAYDTDYMLSEISDKFQGDKCSSLNGKPKIFFIQACRGNKLDIGAENTIPTGNHRIDAAKDKESFRIPVAADFLFAHATPADFYAWRCNSTGSIFIQVLCDCLLKYGRKWNLVKVLTLVNMRVAHEFESRCKEEKYRGKKQIPSVVSQLRAEVILAPKIQ